MDDPGFDIYYNHFYETVCEKKEKIMLGILGLILLFSVIYRCSEILWHLRIIQ